MNGPRSWRSDLLAVAEPGDEASEFLQNVVSSMRLGSKGKSKVALPPLSNLADLVAGFPRFSMSGTLYRFMGRHTQVSLPDVFLLRQVNCCTLLYTVEHGDLIWRANLISQLCTASLFELHSASSLVLSWAWL